MKRKSNYTIYVRGASGIVTTFDRKTFSGVAKILSKLQTDCPAIFKDAVDICIVDNTSMADHLINVVGNMMQDKEA